MEYIMGAQHTICHGCLTHWNLTKLQPFWRRYFGIVFFICAEWRSEKSAFVHVINWRRRALRYLRSPVTRIFSQQLVQNNNKETSKFRMGRIHQWIPFIKGNEKNASMSWAHAFIICIWMLAGKAGHVTFYVLHYNDVILGALASQITNLTIVYSTVYPDADQRNHQRTASLAFVWKIHRGPVNFPHKWPVTRKMFPFDDVIMIFFPQ